MKKSALYTAVLAALLILLPAGTLTPPALAAEEFQVVQVVPSEMLTTFFLSRDVDPAAAICRISNQEAPVL